MRTDNPASCADRQFVRLITAFTLIELLVVISIIALLLAILLPSLSAARQRNKGVVCQTRLRELSHGWHMYADDNNDIAVPGRYGNLGGGAGNPANWYDVGNGLKTGPRWVAMLGKYVGIFAFDRPDRTNDRQDYDNTVYQCPSVDDRLDERNYAYGYNHQFLGNARLVGARYRNFPINRSRISSFAGTVMSADCMGTAAGLPTIQRVAYNNDGTGFNELGNHGWTLDPPHLLSTSDHGSGDAGSPRTTVDPRHQERANVAYCDGHVESNSPYTLGYRQADDGRYLDEGPSNDPAHNFYFSGAGKDLTPPESSAPRSRRADRQTAAVPRIRLLERRQSHIV